MINTTIPYKYQKYLKQSRNKYSQYLKGKRVVVVGPAPSILGSKQHDIINSYDIVVRLNKALPLPNNLKEDIGSRTDVLYNCMNPSSECGGDIDIDLLKKCGVKYLVSPYGQVSGPKYRFNRDILSFSEKNLEKGKGKTFSIPFCHIDTAYFKKLLKIMQLPNTGICTILDILKHPIKELYITGFTFFKGGYIKEYRRYNEKQVLEKMAKYNLHNQEKQLKYMRQILLNDKRIKLDQTLIDILKDKNVNFKINPQTRTKSTVKVNKLTQDKQPSSRKYRTTKTSIRKRGRIKLKRGKDLYKLRDR